MLAAAIALNPIFATQAIAEHPFIVTDHAIIVDSTVNGRKVSCMFDTGFSGSYVLSDSINVGKPTGVMNLQDFVGVFQASTVDVKSLKIGPMDIKPDGMTIVLQPTRDYTQSYGVHCDGIMGLETVGHTIFQINFEKKKFVFYPDSYDITKKPVDGKKTILAKILPLGNNSLEMSVVAPNGNKLVLALDTGNGFFATTHKDALERIGLWKPGANPVYTSQAWVASGPVNTFNLKLKDMTIFGVPVPESVWSIIDLPSSSAEHDGTVGFGFLKNFNVTIDMVRRRVLLEHFTGKVSDDPQGETGITAFYSNRQQKAVIFDVTPGSPAAKAGIKEGDHLIDINGTFIANMSAAKIEDLLKGDVGSTVKLAVSRNGNLDRYELKRVPLVNDLP